MTNHRAATAFLLLVGLTYWQDIAPLLNRHCIECHGMGAALNLSRFPFLSPVTSDQPAIVARILEKVGSPSPLMPPGNRPKLTASEVLTIQQWRDEGLSP